MMDPDENEIYKILGVEQAVGIKTKIVFERIKEEITKRVRMLVNTELNDANLTSAINAKVIAVAGHQMNVCKFKNGELNKLDQVIKKGLQTKNILGDKQAMRDSISNEKKVEED